MKLAKPTSAGLWIVVSSFLMLASLAYVLLAIPPEESQGWVQKIFFFHVPAAFSMYLCLIVGAFFSVCFLVQRKPSQDRWARSCLYTATVFAIVVLTSGPIWAKPIWGTYWTWDPRLTTSFIVFVLLVGYCFLRSIFKEYDGISDRGAVMGAILSIIAVLDVPLIHYSVQLWRGIHPSVLKNPEGLPESYQMALEMMILSTFVLAALFVWTFYRLLDCEDKLEKLKPLNRRS